MEETLVSISCITYNQAHFIRQCLDGFLMQKTTFSFEVLIHDDASTDGTTEIIREYESKYPEIIKPLYEKENQWTKGRRGSAVFNYPRAKGKYIALCEGDDYWIDELKLQTQFDFMEKHPECTMCFHNAKIENNLKNKTTNYPQIEDREYSSNELFSNWIVPTASMFFRKGFLNSEILTNKNILNSDIIYVLLAADKGKVYGSSKKMSTYRIHEGGVTWNPAMNFEREKKYPAHYLFIKKTFKKIPRKIINKRLFSTYRHLQHHYEQQNEYKLAFHCLIRKLYYRFCSF